MAKANKPNKPNVIDAKNLKAQTQETKDRAELFEARARISTAQTDIARNQLERLKIMSEMDKLSATKS